MKPEAQKILTMIEGVTPETPDAALDEIDARMWCWIAADPRYPWPEGKWNGTFYSRGKKFTRSIDAQEALRREGWYMKTVPLINLPEGTRYQAVALRVEVGIGSHFGSPPFYTEPLARLHAWTQVLGMEQEK